MSDDAAFDRRAFLELLGEVLDAEPGTVCEADRERLNRLLRGHAEARRLYRQHMGLHVQLHLDYSGGLAPEAMPERALAAPPFSRPGVRPPRRRASHAAWLAAAAVVVAGLCLAAWARWLVPGTPAPARGEAGLTNEVAVLSRSLGVKWPAPEREKTEGDALPPGLFEIAEGMAQIEFFCGATIIVEGPSELEILSRDRVVLRSGRVSALVPEPARGFVIEGPDFEALDLGTEFSVSVDASGLSNIHVIEGEVDLRTQGGGALVKKLKKGEGGQMKDGAGSFQAVGGTGQGFVTPQELLNRADARWNARHAEWRDSRRRMAEDADTVVYFDFEDQDSWSRQLANRKSEGPNAAIIGARWVAGRWPGKGALEFKRISDRVRLHVAGEYASLTLALWVRVEGLDRRYNSLFLTDGWEAGEPHWHIGDRGQLNFGINGVGTHNSAPVLGVGDLGRWLHLAVTFDASTGQVRHYRDGTLVSTSPAFKPAPLRLGDCEIGNWQPAHSTAAGVRSFNGRVDEFFMSRRALTADEIRAQYDMGNPYR